MAAIATLLPVLHKSGTLRIYTHPAFCERGGVKRYVMAGTLIGLFMAWCEGYNFNVRGSDAIAACLLALLGALVGSVVYALTKPDNPNTPQE